MNIFYRGNNYPFCKTIAIYFFCAVTKMNMIISTISDRYGIQIARNNENNSAHLYSSYICMHSVYALYMQIHIYMSIHSKQKVNLNCL